MVPFARVHATRKRFHDAASVPPCLCERKTGSTPTPILFVRALALAPAIRISPRRARRTRRSRGHEEEGTGRSGRRSGRNAHDRWEFGLGALASRRLGLRALRVLRGESCVMAPPAVRTSHRGSRRVPWMHGVCPPPRTALAHGTSGQSEGRRRQQRPPGVHLLHPVHRAHTRLTQAPTTTPRPPCPGNDRFGSAL